MLLVQTEDKQKQWFAETSGEKQNPHQRYRQSAFNDKKNLLAGSILKLPNTTKLFCMALLKDEFTPKGNWEISNLGSVPDTRGVSRRKLEKTGWFPGLSHPYIGIH